MRHIGVERQQVVPARLGETGPQRAGVAGLPLRHHARAELGGGLARAVGRTAVDHDDFVLEMEQFGDFAQARNQREQIVALVHHRQDHREIDSHGYNEIVGIGGEWNSAVNLITTFALIINRATPYLCLRGGGGRRWTCVAISDSG